MTLLAKDEKRLEVIGEGLREARETLARLDLREWEAWSCDRDQARGQEITPPKFRCRLIERGVDAHTIARDFGSVNGSFRAYMAASESQDLVHSPMKPGCASLPLTRACTGAATGR